MQSLFFLHAAKPQLCVQLLTVTLTGKMYSGNGACLDLSSIKATQNPLGGDAAQLSHSQLKLLPFPYLTLMLYSIS